MPAQWTAEIVGQMHINQICRKDLAKQLGMTPEYVSMVLNGHRDPPDAENRFTKALRDLIAQKSSTK